MLCRQECFPSGACVTIEPVRYIFAGGGEDGVRIGLIQYPPFPEREDDLKEKLIDLGYKLAKANAQWSFSIVMPQETTFFSRRARA